MQQLYNGIYFDTINGNRYYYNDTVGSVTCANSIDISSNQTELNIVHKNDISSVIESEPHLHNYIVTMLRMEGYNQLQLIVTQQCNMRCKYCAYSGIYQNNRVHNDASMDIEVAEKAIRYFHKGYSTVKLRKPNLVPAISFYGGEPLLNFGMIRKAVQLAENLFQGRLIFNMTTNGTLMTSEIVDFVVEHDFRIMFSLNGNKDEHDRLRVFPDGTGTYDVVWHNMQKIRHKNSRFFKNNCSLSVVYDYGTDMRKLYEYFETRLQLPGNYRFSAVNDTFTDWYSRYSTAEIEKHKESMKYLQELYINQLKNSGKVSKVLWYLCAQGFQFALSRPQNTYGLRSVLPFTGTCFPGSKIAVNPDGSFHCCEKINESFPIGDVNIGIDYNLISNMINKYQVQICPECHSCPIKRFCTICFASVATGDGNFKKPKPDFCKQHMEGIRMNLSLLWSLFENGISEDQIKGKVTKDEYEWFWE